MTLRLKRLSALSRLSPALISTSANRTPRFLNRDPRFRVAVSGQAAGIAAFLSAGSALGKDGLVQIPITQQAWLALATERIAIGTPRAGTPRKGRENDRQRDCGSNNTSRQHNNPN
jgi:hypothetical protein